MSVGVDDTDLLLRVLVLDVARSWKSSAGSDKQRRVPVTSSAGGLQKCDIG